MGKAAVIRTDLKGWVNLSKTVFRFGEKMLDSSPNANGCVWH